jgi:hypothetical protein
MEYSIALIILMKAALAGNREQASFNRSKKSSHASFKAATS